MTQSQFIHRFPFINSNLIITNKFGLYPLTKDKNSSLLDRFYIGGPNDTIILLNGLGPKDYNSCIGGDLF